MLSTLSFKQFVKFKGRNGIQKKKLQNKRMKIKFNFEITLNVNC